MLDIKVAFIGAGSMSFGLAALKGLLFADDLDGMCLHLHDVDEGVVERMGALGRYVVATRQGRTRVVAGSDLSAALAGADVVVLSVAKQREELWAEDRALGLQHGINHYAENGGPGALFHTARNLELILPVISAMEKQCPFAWLLNYTNPVPRIGTAIRQASSIRSIGVCHQIEFGYYLAGVLLSDELGLEVPAEVRFDWTTEQLRMADGIAAAARSRIHLLASGLNHFTWMQDVRTRACDGGEGLVDLYPALRAANRRVDSGFEPLSRKLFDLFGLLPVPGDAHVLEFLPYTHNPDRATWERYDIRMYDFDWSRRMRVEQRHLAERIFAERNLALLDGVRTERVELLVSALTTGTQYSDDALNVLNAGGVVPGLPESAIVEVPVSFADKTPVPVAVPELPLAVVELCRRQVAINELAVAGLLNRDRSLLLAALALDPMVDDPELPESLLAMNATLP